MSHCQRRFFSVAPGKRWWVGCLLALMITGKDCTNKTDAATGKPGGEKPAASRMTLQLQDGALTARVSSAPLQRVLHEVSRLSGARIVWLGPREDRQVSAYFTALPVADALQRLLDPNNFLLVYDSNDDAAKLTAIWVSPSKTVVSNPQPQAPHRLTPMQQPFVSGEDPAMMEDEPLMDDAGGGFEQILESYLETAARGADHDRRIESVNALGGLVDHDPRVLPLLQQLSSTESDPQVRAAASEALEGVEW